MFRSGLARTGKWIVFLGALSILLSSCGGKRKKYFEQVMPLVEMNDAIDARVARLPKMNVYKDPNYLQKLEGYIAQKEAIRGQMETMEPPFLVASTHSKLLVAMNNGIRYLRSERKKFLVAGQNMQKTVPRAMGDREEFEIIREYQSQAAGYQVSMKEQMMKKQYERLYYEAKDELERAGKIMR